jgi:hypothetical protein
MDIYVLGEDEALYVKCMEPFIDDTKKKRIPGQKW